MDNKKLIIIDCDGVLYPVSELDVNTVSKAIFYSACRDFNILTNAFDFEEISEQPNYYTFIDNLARQYGIKTDVFMSKMMEYIDYSGIKPDNNGVLQKIKDLSDKYKFCVCSNNHLTHINNVLKAKFNIYADQMPCEIFDTQYANIDGVFYAKQSYVFISKLEKHFGINAKNFLWIDDTPNVIDTVKSVGCDGILVTNENRLIDILNTL